MQAAVNHQQCVGGAQISRQRRSLGGHARLSHGVAGTRRLYKISIAVPLAGKLSEWTDIPKPIKSSQWFFRGTISGSGWRNVVSGRMVIYRGDCRRKSPETLCVSGRYRACRVPRTVRVANKVRRSLGNHDDRPIDVATDKVGHYRRIHNAQSFHAANAQ